MTPSQYRSRPLNPGKGLHSLGVPAALQPTRRMVPGISCESLAVDVARANRIPADICHSASNFQQVLPTTGL